MTQFFPEGDYTIDQVRSAKKNTFVLLESIDSSDRGAGVVPNMTRAQKIVADDLWTSPDLSDYSPSVETSTVQALSGTLSDISYVDISHVPVYLEDENGRKFVTTESVRAVNVDFFEELFQTLHSEALNVRLGCRGLFPGQDYPNIASMQTNAVSQWRRYNDRNKDGIRYADFCLPELDAFVNDPEAWKRFAILTMREAAKYCKPVYAFLNVKYHVDGDQGDSFVDSTFWDVILETCLRYADGVVVQGDDSANWASQQAAPWWTSTQTFISALQAA